jgi:o-succinylbenzoate synthase
MRAHYFSRTFDFKFPAGTSRGVLHQKTSHFIKLTEDGVSGIGECSTIPGLSPDPEAAYEQHLEAVCRLLSEGVSPDNIDLEDFPSIRFGLETALLDLKNGGKQLLFPSAFTIGKQGIPINGLIWMGDLHFMKAQINRKINEGYRCLKMKIGALDFDTEVEILRDIRSAFSPEDLELRLDANGAFHIATAMSKLNILSAFHIHSIEQPIQPNQYEAMRKLCNESPIPIALDEEFIGYPTKNAGELLRNLKPAYIILKPSLLGGFRQSQQWIDAAEKTGTGWWVTSALESNIGLKAIAQWTATLNNSLPQGLGTGQLYQNNIESPLRIENAALWYRTSG